MMQKKPHHNPLHYRSTKWEREKERKGKGKIDAFVV